MDWLARIIWASQQALSSTILGRPRADYSPSPSFSFCEVHQENRKSDNHTTKSIEQNIVDAVISDARPRLCGVLAIIRRCAKIHVSPLFYKL